MKRLGVITLCALATALPASAEVLAFPDGASQRARKVETDDSQFIATAAFDGAEVGGITAEGRIEQSVWTIANGDVSTLQLLAPLREQLVAAGYRPVFECETDVCGGFDFRYQIDVLPEPDMHVDLGDFRYLVAEREAGAKDEYVALMVSRSDNTGFVQVTHVADPLTGATFTASTKTPAPDAPVVAAAESLGAISQQLEAYGHATLDDLTFPTGSSQLGEAEFASLDDLAAFLNGNRDRRVMLVGHTDAEGALESNINLSRNRALSVRDRLVSDYDVAAAQVQADGVGYLAPRATNLTDAGRTQNRRVEVILTSTQ